jgi:hypothetical protein
MAEIDMIPDNILCIRCGRRRCKCRREDAIHFIESSWVRRSVVGSTIFLVLVWTAVVLLLARAC